MFCDIHTTKKRKKNATIFFIVFVVRYCLSHLFNLTFIHGKRSKQTRVLCHRIDSVSVQLISSTETKSLCLLNANDSNGCSPVARRRSQSRQVYCDQAVFDTHTSSYCRHTTESILIVDWNRRREPKKNTYSWITSIEQQKKYIPFTGDIAKWKVARPRIHEWNE